MTWLDYAVLGVMGISVAWGAWHGLAREVMSLAGWVIAFLAGNLFAAPLAETLPRSISPPELRVLLAFVGVFVLALAVSTLGGLLLSKMLKAVGLGGLDRTLGGFFGVARGLVFAAAFALLAGLTRLPLDPIWTKSVSGPLLERAALALKPWLPPAFGQRLRYH